MMYHPNRLLKGKFASEILVLLHFLRLLIEMQCAEKAFCSLEDHFTSYQASLCLREFESPYRRGREVERLRKKRILKSPMSTALRISLSIKEHIDQPRQTIIA